MVCIVCMPIFHPFSIFGWLVDVYGWFQHQAELDKQKALLQEKLQKRQALVRAPGYGASLGQFGSGLSINGDPQEMDGDPSGKSQSKMDDLGVALF